MLYTYTYITGYSKNGPMILQQTRDRICVIMCMCVCVMVFLIIGPGVVVWLAGAWRAFAEGWRFLSVHTHKSRSFGRIQQVSSTASWEKKNIIPRAHASIISGTDGVVSVATPKSHTPTIVFFVH